MKRAPLRELRELTGSLALSAVETQRTLDEHHERNVEAALPAARRLAEVFGIPGALAVYPARPLAQRMEFRAQITLRRSRAHAFALMARPVNLGFRIRHESAEDTECQIQFEIEQVPFPGASV